MANIQIKDLVTVIPTVADLIPLSQNGNTRNATIQEIRDKELRTEVETARGTEANLDARLDKLTTDLSEIEQDVTANTSAINAINSSLSSLGANDLAARNEIMNLELKLKEQSAINFLNKTGIGFYDTFADNSCIDAVNTTATYNSTNKAVDFTESKTLKMVDETFDNFSNLDIALYPSKINKATVSGAVNNSNTVVLSATDKVLTNGDKLFMNNVLNEVTNSVSNFTTYDRTTPVSVINSAYTTSANARPQVLSNGNIIICVYDSANTKLNFYKYDGITYNLLTSWTINASAGFSICSYGTKIYAIAVNTAGTTVPFAKFDATTVGSTITSTSNVDSGQTAFNACSIATNSTGTAITIVVSSKNSTYANSLNIRSAKSIDGGTTWTKQDGTSGVDQVTNINISGYNFSNPYAIYDKNDKPIIIFAQNTPNWYICNSIWTGTAWSNTPVIYNSDSTSHSQSNPVATLQKYGTNAGRIWVVWVGTDSTDTSKNNIRISYSDDNGLTWSAPVKLTSGNVYSHGFPSITSDLNGNIYVLCQGYSATSATYNNIQQIVYNGTSWGSLTEITSQNSNHMYYPSTCDNYYNFEKPITIWQDNANNRVAFYGKWQVGQGYTLTMQNPVTLADSQKVPIVDLQVQQNGTDLVIDNVDLEKFTFKGSNLNTNIAKIKVSGKDNSLNALAYAVA